MNNLSNIFSLIKEKGPKRSGSLYDKYINIIDPKLISQQEIEINHLVTSLSFNVGDRIVAINIYELCVNNKPVRDAICDYLSMIFRDNCLERVDILTKLNLMMNPNLPTDSDLDRVINFDEFERRMLFIQKFGFSVPCEDAIEQLVSFCGSDLILEIGCGLAIWAHLMILSGLNVIATDKVENGGYGVKFENVWTKIERMDHKEAIKTYGSKSNVMFLSWPTDFNNMAVESINLYPGKKLVYIGDGVGGDVVDTEFYQILNDKYVLKKTISIPQWAGFFDKMYFLEKK